MDFEKRRETTKCNCPWCHYRISYYVNPDDFIYQVCPKCENHFWIKPSNSNRYDSIVSVVGKKPNSVHMLNKHEIGLVIDAALIIRDYETVKLYQELRENMQNDEWIIVPIAEENMDNYITDMDEGEMKEYLMKIENSLKEYIKKE